VCKLLISELDRILAMHNVRHFIDLDRDLSRLRQVDDVLHAL